MNGLCLFVDGLKSCAEEFFSAGDRAWLNAARTLAVSSGSGRRKEGGEADALAKRHRLTRAPASRKAHTRT